MFLCINEYILRSTRIKYPCVVYHRQLIFIENFCIVHVHDEEWMQWSGGQVQGQVTSADIRPCTNITAERQKR